MFIYKHLEQHKLLFGWKPFFFLQKLHCLLANFCDRVNCYRVPNSGNKHVVDNDWWSGLTVCVKRIVWRATGCSCFGATRWPSSIGQQPRLRLSWSWPCLTQSLCKMDKTRGWNRVWVRAGARNEIRDQTKYGIGRWWGRESRIKGKSHRRQLWWKVTCEVWMWLLRWVSCHHHLCQNQQVYCGWK